MNIELKCHHRVIPSRFVRISLFDASRSKLAWNCWHKQALASSHMWLIKSLFCVTCWADIYVNIYTHKYKYLIYQHMWAPTIWNGWTNSVQHWYLQLAVLLDQQQSPMQLLSRCCSTTGSLGKWRWWFGGLVAPIDDFFTSHAIATAAPPESSPLNTTFSLGS